MNPSHEFTETHPYQSTGSKHHKNSNLQPQEASILLRKIVKLPIRQAWPYRLSFSLFFFLGVTLPSFGSELEEINTNVAHIDDNSFQFFINEEDGRVICKQLLSSMFLDSEKEVSLQDCF